MYYLALVPLLPNYFVLVLLALVIFPIDDFPFVPNSKQTRTFGSLMVSSCMVVGDCRI